MKQQQQEQQQQMTFEPCARIKYLMKLLDLRQGK